MPGEPSRHTGPAEGDGAPGIVVGDATRRRLAEESATANVVYGIIVSSSVLASVQEETVAERSAALLDSAAGRGRLAGRWTGGSVEGRSSVGSPAGVRSVRGALGVAMILLEALLH